MTTGGDQLHGLLDHVLDLTEQVATIKASPHACVHEKDFREAAAWRRTWDRRYWVLLGAYLLLGSGIAWGSWNGLIG